MCNMFELLQADICHAYQVIRENGIPEENIITMMVDDIAYNKELVLRIF